MQNKSLIRSQIYQLLEVDSSSLISRVVNLTIMALIVINVACVVLETVPEIMKQYRAYFIGIEYLSIVLFSIEYLVRVWVSAERNSIHPWQTRFEYMRSPMALIDLLAVAPFYLGLFIQLDTRYLRVFRLFRVFKFTRYSSSMSMLIQVLKNEMPSIISALTIMLILILFSSAGIYLVERDAQPDVFGSIPAAMWWATVTLTTVGYGDVIPISLTGKVLGVFITILGVGIAALPAGILASGFSSELQHRRDEYRIELMKALSDGSLTEMEIDELHRLRTKLGMSAKEARLLFRITHREPHYPVDHCPHCGECLEK